MIKLEPVAVWNYFHQITQIPRPSKREKQILDFLKSIATQHQLEMKSDSAGNLLIYKSATTGYEQTAKVILQCHVDMVCEKNSDVVFDFEKDAIQTFIEGDWVKARGTTLGADNGIGVAMLLALLTAKNIPHPALECLFTVDEETGLTGAYALENDFLTGDVLINVDSEDDGQIFVGCAGGIDTTAVWTYSEEASPEKSFAFNLSVKGLKGGHSGDDIDKTHGNAIQLLARFLWNVSKQMDLRIHRFEGGNLRNAIPREASALAVIPYSQKETVRVLLNHFIVDVESELAKAEPFLRIDLDSESMPSKVMDIQSTSVLLNALNACPHGVIAMSKDMPGLVETSTNLASVRMLDNNSMRITTSQRSSVEMSKYQIAHTVESVFLLAGAVVTHGDGYPGWKPNLQSSLLHKTKDSYVHLFGEEPKIRAIHAGLECGLFLKKYPHLDMISIGPQMYGAHSPDERLSISSTQKCWKWILEILKNML